MIDNSNNDAASNGPSNFLMRMRVNLVKIIAPSGLTTKELSSLLGIDAEKMFDEALAKNFATEIAKNAKETANALIASNFKELTAETLSALVIASVKLDDTQKARICEILITQAGKDLSYLR